MKNNFWQKHKFAKALVTLIFLAPLTAMTATDSPVMVFKTISKSARYHQIVLRISNASWSVRDYKNRAYNFLDITHEDKQSLIIASYELSLTTNTYRITNVSIRPRRQYFDEAADLFAGNPTGTVIEGNRTSRDGSCESKFSSFVKLTRVLQTQALDSVFSSSCSTSQKKSLVNELSILLDSSSATQMCLQQKYPVIWPKFYSYWVNKILIDPKKNLISCDLKPAKSSFSNGNINLAADVVWSNRASLDAILLHELLHSEFSKEGEDQRLVSSCAYEKFFGSFHHNSDSVGNFAQKNSVNKSDSSNKITQTQIDPTNVTEVRHFITNQPAAASLISSYAGSVATRVASELAVIPAANAALRGDQSSSEITGTITSYDSSNRPIVTLSNGSSVKFSQPFADIPASVVDQVVPPDLNAKTSTDTVARSDVNGAGGGFRAQTSANSNGTTTTQTPVISAGSRQPSSTTSQASTENFNSTIKTPADARAEILKRPSVLKNPAFASRLSDISVQVKYGKDHWGASNPKFRWDLEQMLKAKPKP